MAKSNPPEYERALSLLHAALGEFDPNQPLKRVLPRVPDFGSFEWMLTIIGLEIDLRVDIPESIADDHSRTAAAFCRSVASLPKIDTPGYTLECLGLVAQALLSLDVSGDSKAAQEPRGTRKASTSRATAKVPARSKRPTQSAERATAKVPARSKRAVKSTDQASTKVPARSKRAATSSKRAGAVVNQPQAKKAARSSKATKRQGSKRRA